VQEPAFLKPVLRSLIEDGLSAGRRGRPQPEQKGPVLTIASALLLSLAGRSILLWPQRRTCGGETTQAKYDPKAACAIG
jgi:hypothetical protein